ncbi:30S ribosomal protein S10 [Patescibacteria group bacterium]|nr:30S ribosomal protein S10 [Patescibacteria group bacterium]
MTQISIRVLLKSFDHKILDQTSLDIIQTALNTGARIIGPVPLPTQTEKFTVIRGPHIDKRSQETFERRTHRRLIDITDPTNRTLDSLSNLSLPAGVGIEIKA